MSKLLHRLHEAEQQSMQHTYATHVTQDLA